MERRTFIGGVAAAAIGASAVDAATAAPTALAYGLIGKMKAQPGQRDALERVLLDGVSGMPGCLSYIVATDPADPDLIWITEAWESKDAHRAALALPSVRAAIAKGRSLIAGMEIVAETVPVGGHGLAGRPAG